MDKMAILKQVGEEIMNSPLEVKLNEMFQILQPFWLTIERTCHKAKVSNVDVFQSRQCIQALRDLRNELVLIRNRSLEELHSPSGHSGYTCWVNGNKVEICARLRILLEIIMA